MSANPDTAAPAPAGATGSAPAPAPVGSAAPKGRTKPAQGKERSDAALGHAPQNTPSPEGAKAAGNLPPGWRWTTIGELKTLSLYGPRFSSDDYRDSGVFVLRTTDISESGKVVTSRAPQLHLTDDELTRYQLKRGDLLITRTGSLGTLAVFNDEVKAIAGAYLIQYRVAGPPITSWYVFYALKSPAGQNHLVGSGAGVGRPNLNAPTIDAFGFGLPPEDEQRRIVAEIEKQFTRLEAGMTALRRVQANLKRYRAAVLKAGCEGRLVPTEAALARSSRSTKNGPPAYETGEALLARILTERRQNWQGRGQYKEPAAPKTADLPTLPEGWTWATAQQLNLANRPCAYGVLQPGEDVPDGVPFVRVGDINNGKVELANMKRISTTIATQYPRTKLHGGELAITLVGAIGRTAIIPDSLAGGNTARAVGIIPLTKQANAHWVEIWFRNPTKNAEMDSKSHEVARKTLNLEDVRVASIALPPLAEQTRIVAEVERRLSVVEELEAVVSANLQRATRLRQSILQRAFTGML